MIPGWAKGIAFTRRLGYDINNWQKLCDEINKNKASYPVSFKKEDKYGKSYEQLMVLKGVNKKYANVVVGWKTKGDSTWMTTVYIKEAKYERKD